MKISIDGGALCSPSHKRYGTFSFSVDLLGALSRYDTDNIYYLYTYCALPKNMFLNRNIIHCRIRPKTMWMNFRVPIEEFFKKPDVFLATNQALPLFTKSAIVAFSHGASFVKKPEFYKYSKIRLRAQLDSIMKRSNIVVVSSEDVMWQIAELYPSHKNKLRVLPYGVPADFTDRVIRKPERFFMFVGMNHRVKNVQTLLNIFKKFTQNPAYAGFGLKLVGPFTHLKNPPSNVQILGHVSRSGLADLYRSASAYLTVSHYESFNYPALEALSTGCPVIGLRSAIISEMKKYVTLTENNNDFVAAMELAAENRLRPVDTTNVKEEFSWQKYVNRLVSIYSEI